MDEGEGGGGDDASFLSGVYSRYYARVITSTRSAQEGGSSTRAPDAEA